MASPNPYFFLTEGRVFVNGASNSVVLDLDSGKIYQSNKSAKRIIELGQQGLRVSEVIENLGLEFETENVRSFLIELKEQGMITFSDIPDQTRARANILLPRLNFLWIEITSQCNLHCVHCYAEADENRQLDGLLKEEIIRLIDESATLGCRRLQFTGGEPTLNNDLRDLINHAHDKGFEFIEVFTNGTLLDEDMIKFFAEKKIHAALSIYSYRSETHDAITGIAGSYEKTLDSIKLLLAYGVPTRCAVVAMKQNEKELDETSLFLSKLGILDRAPDPIRPSGRGKSMDNMPLRYLRQFMRTQPSFLVTRENYEKNKKRNSCWFGKAAVTNSGDVVPCVFAREQVAGNIHERRLSEILSGERMLGFWSLTKDRVEVCKDCEYRYVCEDCRPLAFGFTKNVYAKSPRCTYDPHKGEWGKVENPDLSITKCIDLPEIRLGSS